MHHDEEENASRLKAKNLLNCYAELRDFRRKRGKVDDLLLNLYVDQARLVIKSYVSLFNGSLEDKESKGFDSWTDYALSLLEENRLVCVHQDEEAILEQLNKDLGTFIVRIRIKYGLPIVPIQTGVGGGGSIGGGPK